MKLMKTNMGRVIEHNQEVIASANYRARDMQLYPSPLEMRMQKFLMENRVEYETQKIFYIYGDNSWIIRYYIADFYIPEKKIIIEVDGKKYHDHHKQHDKCRDRTIQDNYPEVEILRYTWSDLGNRDKMDRLLVMIQ